jgi:hypothetical protein
MIHGSRCATLEIALDGRCGHLGLCGLGMDKFDFLNPTLVPIGHVASALFRQIEESFSRFHVTTLVNHNGGQHTVTGSIFLDRDLTTNRP